MPANERVGFRLGAALYQRICGPDARAISATARALILLGLHHLGEDLAPYQGEAVAILARIPDLGLRDALQEALFNKCSTNVQHLLNIPDHPSDPSAEQVLAGLFDDPLGSIGIEV